MRDPDARHFEIAEVCGRSRPSMACEDAIVLVDEHRLGKAELLYALGKLLHLLARMGPRIPRPGFEVAQRELLDIDHRCLVSFRLPLRRERPHRQCSLYVLYA